MASDHPAAALTATALGEVLEELRTVFLGATLREVQALPPRDALLVFHGPEDSVRRLRVSVSPDGPRVHLQHGRVQRYAGPIGPFFERIDRCLRGARLARIEQPRGDRMALFAFEGAAEEVGASGRCALLAELTGRHANLMLLDGSERVLELLVNAPTKKKGGAAPRPPRLTVGEPWVPPPGAAPNISGPPRALLETIPLHADDEEVTGGPRGVDAPLSRRIESVIGAQVERVHVERDAKRVRERLERRLQRARSTVHGLEQRRIAAAGAERVAQDGELLKAALGELQRGMESILLQDWYSETGEPRRIELDPRRSGPENVERVFKRAQKLDRAAAEVEREIERARGQVEALERLIAERLDSDPLGAETAAVQAGLLEPLKAARAVHVQEKKERRPYRPFVGLHGAEILVGRSSRDNDQLTFRVARGNDLWLHTSDSPGSHVILRCKKGCEPHPEDVLDAAILAIHFSPQKEARRAGVHVVPVKQVKKPKGAPPGLVTLAGGKRRDVRMEPDRLQRLLDATR